jgi:hypothetical protein
MGVVGDDVSRRASPSAGGYPAKTRMSRPQPNRDSIVAN